MQAQRPSLVASRPQGSSGAVRLFIGSALAEAYLTRARHVFSHTAGEGILSCLLSAASAPSALLVMCSLGCSRPVLFANSIVALTASMFGRQCSIGPSINIPLSRLLE
jgi:hypothetical protein